MTENRANAWMKAWGMKFEDRDVDLNVANFDMEASRHLQVRLFEVSQEHVEMLANDYARGESLPQPILVLQDDGKFAIVAGMHRIPAARKSGRKTLKCSVITHAPDTARVKDLAVITNTEHGLPLDRHERARYARTMHANGRSVDEIVEVTKLSENQVRGILDDLKAEAKLKALKIDHTKLRKSDKLRISQLKDDTLAHPVVRMLQAHPGKLETQDVSDLVRDLNKTRTSDERKALLAAKEAALQDPAKNPTVQVKTNGATVTKPVKRTAGSKKELLDALVQLGKLDPKILNHAVTTPKDRADLRNRCMDGINRLSDCVRALS